MAKKRKQKNQDWDDWEDAPDDTMVAEGNGDQFQVHLEDYVIKEKVSAFVRCYALVLQCSGRVLCAKNADFDGMIAGGGSAVSYA